jgi:hypothetical protein
MADMNNERVEGGPFFYFKDAGDRFFTVYISRQSVYGFGGESDHVFPL